MRNYLFDRSPASAQTPARPVSPGRRVYTPAAAAPRRRRSPLPWLIGFVVLMVALALAGAVIQLWGDNFLPPAAMEGNDGYYDFFWEWDSNDSFTPVENKPTGDAPTMTRAPLGDGTVLTLVERPEEKLTAGEVYEKALPSVVSIQSYTEMGASAGSGVVMSADGYIITNYHVIEGAQSAWITTLDNYESYEATLVGYAADLDLAVLKVEATGLTAAEFGSSRTLAVGDEAYALGNPMGYLYGTFTEGIISAVAQQVTIDGYRMSLLQTSAPLNSGNSGGALLNEYGQVVGITSAKISSSTDVVAEGLGLAIPISDIRGCVNSIIAYGEVVTPRIGITCYDVQVDGVNGILVATVEPGDPAMEAGLQVDDFITAANDIPINGVEELKDIFYDVGVGGTVTLTVQRGGETITVSMELAG